MEVVGRFVLFNVDWIILISFMLEKNVFLLLCKIVVLLVFKYSVVILMVMLGWVL